MIKVLIILSVNAYKPLIFLQEFVSLIKKLKSSPAVHNLFDRL